MQKQNQKALQTVAEWNIYWAKKNKSGTGIYDVIASFYRKFIIKRILNVFLFKHLNKGFKVLHAGCGSGQVDTDAAMRFNITAIDISSNAVMLYKKLFPAAEIVEGDIFLLPFNDAEFDGIYNLGVMEHFTEEEILKILKEFYRVLKPGGKTIILWPPVNGLTVRVLDFIHFITNKIFRMNLQLHPPEITRLKNKNHAVYFFEKSGFQVIDYYFGPLDAYTQAVIVAVKK